MRLADLAESLGRPVEGAGQTPVRGAAPVEEAGPEEVTYVASARYTAQLAASRAGAVILPSGLDAGGRPAIRSPHPRLDFARAVALLHPVERPAAGVDPGARVAPDAAVDPAASVGAGAVVGARSRIGPRSVVHAGAFLYADVEVGADCEIHAGCVLREGTRVGDRVLLQPGVVIGGDGFGYQPDERGAWVRIPHRGRVVLEDDVEIGANSTVDRATFGETRIARGVKIDNLVMIAHNCDVGEDALIVAQSGLAGSAKVGRRAILMAKTGVADHRTIGDGAFTGASAGVARDVPAGARVWGTPALDEHVWRRMVAVLPRLPELLRRLRRLERRVDEAPDA